ncbi:MAG: thermonuclease family protein [Polaromonas sp.]
MKTRKHLFNALIVTFSVLATAEATADAEISSFAFVQPDGTLKVSHDLIHLYGIYIPPTDQTCYTFIRPVLCGTRASLALDFKISGDFVHCVPRATHPDGSITASCSVGHEDLSAWMLQKGWAVALPDSPFEYQAMEKIARSRGFGVWGIPIDTFRQRK